MDLSVSTQSIRIVVRSGLIDDRFGMVLGSEKLKHTCFFGGCFRWMLFRFFAFQGNFVVLELR